MSMLPKTLLTNTNNEDQTLEIHSEILEPLAHSQNISRFGLTTYMESLLAERKWRYRRSPNRFIDEMLTISPMWIIFNY